MENKPKFIIFGLIGVSLIFFVLYVQTLTSKQLLVQEREDLKSENTTLRSKLDKLTGNIRGYENKLNMLKTELDKVFREKQEVDQKYEFLHRANQELLQKVKSQQTTKRSIAPITPKSLEPLPEEPDEYWAMVLQQKTSLELQLNEIGSELKSIEISNEQLQREKSNLELDVNNLQRERDDLLEDLNYNQEHNKRLIDRLSQELVREKNDKTREINEKLKIRQEMKAVKSDNSRLVKELKVLTIQKVNLEKRLQKLQDEKGAIERRFSEVEERITDKISQIDTIKAQLENIRGTADIGTEVTVHKREDADDEFVELPPIVVRPQKEDSGEDFSGSVGKVLTVNRENNFVIIDLGENSGIKIGDTFKVYRGTKGIATIQVIKLSRSVAACEIKKEFEKVKSGDSIR